MRDAIQKQLDELASFNDPRTNVFDIQLKELEAETIFLTGKLLEEKQLEALKELFSNHFPSLSLDTASVRILEREPHEGVHVATNLTGLYEKPTFGMPLSSELYFGVELEVLEAEKRWVFTRQDDGTWNYAKTSDPKPLIELVSIGCHLSVDDVYDQVTLDEGTAE